MPTAAGGLNAQAVTRAQPPAVLGGEPLRVQAVLARCARLPAGRARRAVAAPLGEQREAHFGEGLELADDAVAAAVGARSTRFMPARVGHGAQRELELERLYRRVEGVR